jgi:hypothetical protein
MNENNKIDFGSTSLAFNTFYVKNMEILEKNLECILWSLNEIKNLLDSHPDLIDEFDTDFDEDECDIEAKIDESINITLNQYYVLLFSYLDEYKLKLEKKTKFKKRKKEKSIFSQILSKEITDYDKYYEIRNIIVHQKKKIDNSIKSLIKNYIDSSGCVQITQDNYKYLFEEIKYFVRDIDEKAVKKFPLLLE